MKKLFQLTLTTCTIMLLFSCNSTPTTSGSVLGAVTTVAAPVATFTLGSLLSGVERSFNRVAHQFGEESRHSVNTVHHRGLGLLSTMREIFKKELGTPITALRGDARLFASRLLLLQSRLDRTAQATVACAGVEARFTLAGLDAAVARLEGKLKFDHNFMITATRSHDSNVIGVDMYSQAPKVIQIIGYLPLTHRVVLERIDLQSKTQRTGSTHELYIISQSARHLDVIVPKLAIGGFYRMSMYSKSIKNPLTTTIVVPSKRTVAVDLTYKVTCDQQFSREISSKIIGIQNHSCDHGKTGGGYLTAKYGGQLSKVRFVESSNIGCSHTVKVDGPQHASVELNCPERTGYIFPFGCTGPRLSIWGKLYANETGVEDVEGAGSVKLMLDAEESRSFYLQKPPTALSNTCTWKVDIETKASHKKHKKDITLSALKGQDALKAGHHVEVQLRTDGKIVLDAEPIKPIVCPFIQ